MHRSILLLIGRSAEFIGGIATVFGAHEDQYFPKIIRILDDGAEWRHRPDDIFPAYTGIAQLLQFVAAEDDEPKQRVVITAVDPDIVGQRGANAAAAAAAVATAARIAQQELSTF